MNDVRSRLGGYVLPGGPTDARPAIEQGRALEACGLGSIYIGERYATKDLGALAGALTQQTSHARLIAAITHIGTRHPMALASLGQTLQSLSDGRFTLGFGRGAAGRWTSYGVTPPTARMLADTATILRQLWRGELVSYDGPAGRFPDLQLMELADVAPPPLLLAGIGPRTLALAGSSFDGVILHPLLTPDAVARASAAVRTAAEQAGRDPATIEIHATVITAPDRPFDSVVGARGLGYLLVHGLGESIVAANGWSTAELDRIRSHPRFAGLAYHQLKSVPSADLANVSRDLPSGWLTDGTASGTAADCAARIATYLECGATNVLLHGMDSESIAPLVAAITSTSTSTTNG
jgi:5,10-methylenetetrahydromethanopterin reductase